MHKRWSLSVAILGLVLTGVWGYSQYVSRQRWENRAETQYQRAFIDLTNNLGGLEAQLAKAGVGTSPRFLRQSFADIWRLAYAAQEKLGQLPIGAVELTRMKMLLAKVATFAYKVTDRPAEELRLSEADWKTLQGLRNQARYVSGQLTSMQANIVQNNLRWVDVDRLNDGRMTAAVATKRVGTNTVTKSLAMVEDGLKRMPDPGFPESAVIFRPKPKALEGAKKISTTEGARIAARFAGEPGTRYTTKYVGRVRGDMPTFLYTLTPDGRKGPDAAPIRVSVTEYGGRVAWMLSERPAGVKQQIDLDQATAAAERFVRRNGLSALTVVCREEMGTVDVITMAPVKDGAVHYPELVKCVVAVDSGKVIGFEGVPYLTFHDPSHGAGMRAKISEAEARRRISPHLEVDRVRRAVILDNNNQEQLCYEVDGKMKDERFLVYLSAQDGSEVKIRRVDANGVEID